MSNRKKYADAAAATITSVIVIGVVAAIFAANAYPFRTGHSPEMYISSSIRQLIVLHKNYRMAEGAYPDEATWRQAFVSFTEFAEDDYFYLVITETSLFYCPPEDLTAESIGADRVLYYVHPDFSKARVIVAFGDGRVQLVRHDEFLSALEATGYGGDAALPPHAGVEFNGEVFGRKWGR